MRGGTYLRAYMHFNGLFHYFKKAVNAPPDTKKKALLQDTPTASVYTQLQKLASQNPACEYNLFFFFSFHFPEFFVLFCDNTYQKAWPQTSHVLFTHV